MSPKQFYTVLVVVVAAILLTVLAPKRTTGTGNWYRVVCHSPADGSLLKYSESIVYWDFSNGLWTFTEVDAEMHPTTIVINGVCTVDEL